MARRIKGVGLLSGGLDSVLAVKVVLEQLAEVEGVTFSTPFFGPDAGLEAGRMAGIPVRAVDIGEAYMEMLKDPVYGYGKHLNPCIDCHALMLKEAGKIMEREGADFLFTGEVVGQRPMSQRRDSMRSVEKLSGYQGRVLRPLSAKLLPPTLVEEEGLLDREKLLDLHGRGRKRQMELARHYGIHRYPQPGGGCLLTKEGFAGKLRRLMSFDAAPALHRVESLKWGRLFRISSASLLVAGRDRKDNGMLRSLAGEEEVVLHVPGYRGPTGLLMVSEREWEEDGRKAGRIVAAFSDIPRGARVRVQWRKEGETGSLEVVTEGRDGFLRDRV